MKTYFFIKARFRYLTFFLLSAFAMNRSVSQDFTQYPVYSSEDLGANYSKVATVLKVWAPSAGQVLVNIYTSGFGGTPKSQMYMQKTDQGVWKLIMEGDQKGLFYTYQIRMNDKWLDETVDPYAKFVGLNGRRAMIGDLSDTNPAGWDKDKSAKYGDPVDAVIYELHVRDATISENSSAENKGKYLGLTEHGKLNGHGEATGIDHIKELGITHVHLLPTYDFFSIDESQPDKPQYNWGYDPLNYNVPEGSYATNASDPIIRIREFKKMIKTFHDNGVNVVMDMVYNHTMFTEKSWFNLLVPGYYYRQNADGGFSNATACGNETASERPMMRKFIIESLLYWLKEYHIDGFRLDLMGVHDLATVNELASKLREIKPDILLYGEGWTAGASPYPEELRAVKKNAYKLDGVAVFSDDIRDGIKGSVFDHADKGFVSGKK
ncbi:MAG: type I pullulanase, partial [Chitinophagaceae bacterium]